MYYYYYYCCYNYSMSWLQCWPLASFFTFLFVFISAVCMEVYYYIHILLYIVILYICLLLVHGLLFSASNQPMGGRTHDAAAGGSTGKDYSFIDLFISTSIFSLSGNINFWVHDITGQVRLFLFYFFLQQWEVPAARPLTLNPQVKRNQLFCSSQSIN